jgi:DNA-binding response OmpR family regulator
MILLVEDNEANREMLMRRLTRKGFMVCCPVDGRGESKWHRRSVPTLY